MRSVPAPCALPFPHARALLAAAWLAAAAASAAAAPVTPAPPGGPTAAGVDERLADGDRLYGLGQLREASAAYAGAVGVAPTSLPALLKLVRAESEWGETESGDAQRRTWASAVEHARAAVRLAPDSADTHAWLAVALGREALHEGPRTKLAMSREIKSEVDRALELNPNLARAWHVLAMWNVKIAGLNFVERMAAHAVLGGVPPGASDANAERAFEKAIALEPDHVLHRLEYGRLLRDEKRWADARAQLEKAVSLPPTSDALDPRYQEEARALLARLPRPAASGARP